MSNRTWGVSCMSMQFKKDLSMLVNNLFINQKNSMSIARTFSFEQQMSPDTIISRKYFYALLPFQRDEGL